MADRDDDLMKIYIEPVGSPVCPKKTHMKKPLMKPYGERYHDVLRMYRYFEFSNWVIPAQSDIK